jgi:hypothetical protein
MSAALRHADMDVRAPSIGAPRESRLCLYYQSVEIHVICGICVLLLRWGQNMGNGKDEPWYASQFFHTYPLNDLEIAAVIES